MSTKYYVANVPEDEQLYAEWMLNLYVNYRHLCEITEGQYAMWFPGAPLNYEACRKKAQSGHNIPVKELLQQDEWKRFWEGRELYSLLHEKAPVYIGRRVKFPVQYDISCEVEGKQENADELPYFVSHEIFGSIMDNYDESGRVPLIRISEYEAVYGIPFTDACEKLLWYITECAEGNRMQPFIDTDCDLKAFYEQYIDLTGTKCAGDLCDFFDNPAIYDICVELAKKMDYEMEPEDEHDEMKMIFDAIRPKFLAWLENDYRKRFIDASDNGK